MHGITDGRVLGQETAQTRDSDFVQSLDRGLAVIRAFGPDRERLSLSVVARATSLRLSRSRSGPNALMTASPRSSD